MTTDLLLQVVTAMAAVGLLATLANRYRSRGDR